MDILTHALSGVAFGTVISGLSKCKSKQQIGIVALGGFGGILPDIDAISLWSRFDSIFGRLFGLNYLGKDIYSSKFWYSHHGFMHSVIAGLLIGILLGLFIHLVKTKFRTFAIKIIATSFKDNKLYLIAFIGGFLLHLLGDFPTPSSTWDGLNMFWPSNTYVGGTGEIWWWNNYDIFLITLSIIILNLIILLVGKLMNFKVFRITISIFLLGFVSIIYQIKTRSFDFNYKGHTNKYDFYEQKSKDIQKQILGTKLYGFMIKLDNKVKINF
jgi:inner membrane protein